jgi:hypothetical protein
VRINVVVSVAEPDVSKPYREVCVRKACSLVQVSILVPEETIRQRGNAALWEAAGQCMADVLHMEMAPEDYDPPGEELVEGPAS